MQALQLIISADESKCPIDIVFTDNQMPVLSGRELAKEIRKL